MKSRLNTKKVGFFTESDPIVNSYYNEIRNKSVLSQEEEIALFKAYRENGDEKAKNKIIESNQKFVVSVAKKFIKNTNGSILPDLINEGNIGLMIAIDKFDINSGFKFITYAVWYIQREIKAFLMDAPLISKTNLQKTKFYVENIKETFRKVEGREITIYEIIEKLETDYGIKIIDESDVFDLSIVTIDTPPENYPEQYSDFSFVENELNKTSDIQNHANSSIDEEDNRTMVKEYLSILLPREKEIIELFYGINPDSFSAFTLDDIAEKYSYTTERIRQILKNSLDILKIRSKVSKITNIKQYLPFLSKLEIFLLNLHLNKKYTPEDISNQTVFSAESIQQALCNSIEVIYRFHKSPVTTNIPVCFVPVILEKPTNITFNTLNTNENFCIAQIELGKVYKKFLQLGWLETEIAQKWGKSVSHIKECLSLL
ncbi:MAG: sigma-70 family RNA polymerase sigma factor [Firmicutes bacterium]|nr:sigma-70 family RNA polymerase sigma factor [Bacillota bacterium]